MLWNRCTKCGTTFEIDWEECPVKCEATEIIEIELTIEEMKERKYALYARDLNFLSTL